MQNPDRLQLTRIHYVCPFCATDIFRDTRSETVKCGKCQRIWRPDTWANHTLAFGREETNPHPERYDFPRCRLHDVRNCKECEKRELYSE